MLPTLAPGDIIISRVTQPREGDIVIATLQTHEVVKRIRYIKKGTFYLIGDNSLESTDSREWGPVKREAIKGVMLMKLPAAKEEKRTNRLRFLALSVAAVLLVLAVAQLIRFDKFIPLFIDRFGDAGLLIASSLVITEVFALPFLLGMALSPLARWMGVASGLVAGGLWTIVAFLSFLSGQSDHWGIIKAVPSGMWAICFGIIIMSLVAFIGFQPYLPRKYRW